VRRKKDSKRVVDDENRTTKIEWEAHSGVAPQNLSNAAPNKPIPLPGELKAQETNVDTSTRTARVSRSDLKSSEAGTSRRIFEPRL